MRTHLVDDLRALLRDRHELALVVLFGSCSQGTEKAGSDVDVAVLPTGELSSVDEARLEGAIAHVAGREVDLVRLFHVASDEGWGVAVDLSRGHLLTQRP